MGLERGLGDVKDELQMFIESQKRKIDHDKRELKKAQAALSPRDNHSDRDGRYSTGHDYSNDAASETEDYQTGLPVGEYENRKKAMRQERIREYKKYAAQKELRRTGKIDTALLDDLSPRSNGRKERDVTFTQRNEVSTPDIVDAYAALLRKKRAEERSYREKYDDPEIGTDRRVRFNDSDNENFNSRKQPNIDDEELFQWAREKANLGRRQHSAGNIKSEKKADAQDEDKTRAKSVPPTTAAGIFGGSESSDANKKRKEQYKKDLEMQIKEKEEQKMRDKLKKLGRISSSDEINVNSTKKSEPKATVKPATPEKGDNRDIESRTSNRSRGRKQERSRFDDDDLDPRFRDQPRGWMPYRGMGGYDPYMQMIPGRFDPRMDPYLMQNPGYGGFPGYGGMIYGPNPGMMPRMDRFDDRGRDFVENSGGRVSQRDRQQTPRTQSPKREGSRQEKSKKDFLKSNVSPRAKVAAAGVFGDDTPVDKEAERAAKLAYQEELKKQMQEKQAAKEKEKKEREKYDAKLEAEMMIYDPWGKSGGGAPVKDQTGRLVADLRTLHKHNEDGQIVSPRNDAKATNAISDLPKESPVLAALSGFQNIANASPNTSPRANLNDHPQGRGAALLELQGETKNQGQKIEQREYQDFLRQQIEEKKRLKLEEERKQKEEEDKENRRLEEQRIKMEQEFLLEQEKERKKEEEVRQKNDEMRKVAEQKRNEAERQRKEIDEDRFRSVVKRSSEMNQHVTETRNRAPSPPIPTLQSKQSEQNRPVSRQLPTLAKQQQSEHGSERPVSRPIPALTKHKMTEIQVESHATQVSNPPSRQGRHPSSPRQRAQASNSEAIDMQYLTSIREQLLRGSTEKEGSNSSQSIAQDNLMRQLAALRQQLSNEEHKVQIDLEKNVEKYQETKTKSKSKSTNEENGSNEGEIFGRARIRKGSATKRAHPKHADEFKKLTDASSVLDFKSKFPNKPVTSSELDLQQKEFIRLQEQKLQALRQAINVTSNYLMSNIDNERSSPVKQRRPSKQSLLESETQFINMYDFSTRVDSRLSTAKSNRRSFDIEDPLEEQYSPRAKTPGGYSVHSMTSQAIDEMAAKNEERLRKLRPGSGRSVMTPDDPEGFIENYLDESAKSEKRPQTRQSEKSLPTNTLRM